MFSRADANTLLSVGGLRCSLAACLVVAVAEASVLVSVVGVLFVYGNRVSSLVPPTESILNMDVMRTR